MNHSTDLNLLIEYLEPLVEKLKAATTIEDKYKFLCSLEKKEEIVPEELLDTLHKKFIYKSLQLIEQDKHLFYGYEHIPDAPNKINDLLDQLWQIDKFYSPIGGIAGYHLTFLQLIVKKNHTLQSFEYEKPEGTNLTKEDQEVAKAVRNGIEFFHQIGEIYPVAGAGDRLNLKDEISNEPLPAAVLNFSGFTLLNGLIRDLQAREFLYYKCTGKQACTPVILMTSHEKNNDQHIKNILAENKWFHRSPKLFFFILQPLVPVITVNGLWVIQEPLKINVKPGGHGVIWKLAENEGAFEWFLQHNRSKALVRQINNPIAGIDHGLTALIGIGCKEEKAFGFATCFRLLGAAEGVDVLIEKETQDGFEYRITNIEYTEFDHFGIKDIPCEPNSRFSLFPSNTNILFVDIETLKEILDEHPFPGLLVNLKSQSECLDHKRCLHKIEAGRVESTMQNIADFIVTKSKKELSSEEKKNLRTFVTFNHREKTISTTKTLSNGNHITGTPDGAFFDLQLNARKLFTDYCNSTLPEIQHEGVFKKHPPFLITYHPALGPLYSVIKQKIQRITFSKGAELQLEIAELYMCDTSIKGSLLIKALCPLGHLNENNELIYSENMGKCQLRNCEIDNEGIDFSAVNTFWQSDIVRNEVMCIQLEENAEFFAENVVFKGPFQICVPSGYRMVADMDNKKVRFTLSSLPKPSWSWAYSFDEFDKIQLEMR